MEIRDIAARCLRDESQALLDLIPQLDGNFDGAVNLLYNCKGHVVLSGVGKSGHIAAKIAATLASTGTPAFYVNPLDALHGDLGMITENDVALLISNSGNSDEILRMAAFLEERKLPIVALTGNPESLLAHTATHHINVVVEKEACPLNLAPTSSTTAAMAMGDALACVLIELRHFRAQDFAMFHPGGLLGKKLVTKVKDVMYTEHLPIIPPEMKLIDALISISNGHLGLGVVMREDRILGIITDGDIRRAVEGSKENVFNISVSEAMTKTPKTINPEAKLTQIQYMFHKYKIHSLLVVDKNNHLLGIVDYFAIMN
ncbi:MAG: KpsF/GutQ family sugar-phosphate isomerase [Bacteroidaceae bacterium]|nr:KpsF/GutQ family sugar-phosphate isomerase [Bacteroidaceae bacterium]